MKRGTVIVPAVIAGLGLPAAFLFAFYGASLQDVLYFNQKIFYFHVPAAMTMFASAFVCGIASALYLFRRQPQADRVAAGAADRRRG